MSKQVSGYLDRLRLRGVFAREPSGCQRLEDKLLLTQFTVDHSPDFVQWLGPDGRILEVNQSSVTRYGYSRKEMLGLRVFDLDPTLSPVLWLEQSRKARSRGSAIVETVHRTKHGEVFPVEVAGNRVEYQGTEYFVTFVRDISGRKKTEDSLRLTQVSVDRAADMIFWTDADGRLIYVNQSTTASLGYSHEELQSLHLWDIAAGPSAAQYACSWAEGAAAGPCRQEGALRTKDGRLIPVEVTATSLELGGRLLRVHTARDMSEQKQAEQLLKESEARYRQLFELETDAILLTDDESGRFLEVNKAAAALYGYSRAELLEMTNAEVSAEPELTRLTTTESTFHVPLRWHRKKDGTLFAIEGHGRRLEWQGRPVHMVVVRDITERRLAEEALKTSQAQLEAAMDLADLVNWEFDVDTGIFTFNDRFYALYGTTAALEGGYQMPAEVYAKRFVHPDEQRLVGEEVKKAIQATDPDFHAYLEHRIVRRDGEIRHIAVRYGFAKDKHGRTTKTHGANQDITERTQTAEALALAQDQLRQAQKMEAIGQLAGGIAHDFNNLLTAIMGYTDLILAPGRALNDCCRPDLEEIRSAAERASTLTRQILAFSRRQALRPTVVSLNEVVTGTERLLRRTLGEDLELATVLCPDLGLVEVDVSQFETVLVNLALNARDAMSMSGGRLTIETANVELGEDYAETHPVVKPGPYVMVAVSDTGTGMDEETSARAFEPFFTTKEPGRGTGLGLSTVYGIVKQSGGNVFLYSEPGRGTIFKIYLPRVGKASARRERAAVRRSPPQRGQEAILVVEDEEAVQTLAARVLSDLGYEVRVASSGRQALSLLAARRASVDLLLTDIMLPGEVRGDQLAREAKAAYPELAVLFMSGYTRDSIVHGGRLDERVDYLEKPFTPARLGQYVREVLDRRGLDG